MADVRVKICGIKQAEHAIAARQAGADYLGFVFAPSKRHIMPEQAAQVLAIADAEGTIPSAVGVFVNETVEQIVHAVQVARLSYVQLSGPTPPEDCRRIRELSGVPIIKAIHIGSADDLSLVDEYAGIADYLLLDTASQGSYGGTGQAFDWNLFVQAQQRAGMTPMFLAGGLNPDNIGAAIHQTQPFGVDVSSGVETNGSKDSAKIHAFVAAARGEGREKRQ